MKRHLICVLHIIFCAMMSSAQYSDSIPGFPADSVGVYIEEIESGNVIADINGDGLFIPASVTKILTASSALTLLNPKCRLRTDVYINGTINDSILHGDVIIGSSGDPTLESSFFPDRLGFPDSLASSLRTAGVKEIYGNIKVLPVRGIKETVPYGWEIEDLKWPYGAILRSMNFSDNSFTYNVAQDVCTPFVPGLKIHNVKKRKCPGLSYNPADNVLTVNRRKIRQGSESYAMTDPGASLISAIKASLCEYNIALKEYDPSSSTDYRRIFSHLSPDMEEILSVMMKRSHNLMAEGMLIAQDTSGDRDSAIRQELTLWSDAGVDTTGVRIFDGSGLSRSNRLTPYFLADILVKMQDNPYFGQFADMFPVCGISGTVRRFLKGTSLEGKLALKTGSMNGVQCYAGYRLDEFGQPTHIVIVMINGFRNTRSAVKKEVEKFLLEKLS